ncbi:hypothetical protein IWW50_001020 [Coemansia erecta]|nr:hypothetical protein GGF43_004707 [Coemansia sp. RSA 2618]KAJ2829145.1 hypothetical protein IWW50_001020 [Coemansia erecta]
MGDRDKGALSRVPAPQVHAPEPDLGLHAAASRGDIGSICYALLGGQPIDSLRDGLQPIHIAAMQDDPAVIEILLQNGADANARTMPLPEDRPADALQRAERKLPRKLHQRGIRSRSSFSFLKYSGVGPISAPIGFTTGLHSMQAARSMVDDVATGYACHSPPELSDLYREYHSATPLHFAVAGANLACIEALLHSGACADAADSYGNTPASVAVVGGNPDVAALVCHQGPDPITYAMSRPFISAPNTYQHALDPAAQQHVSLGMYGLVPLLGDSGHAECEAPAADPRMQQQLPSPNPSDRSMAGTSPTATALSHDQPGPTLDYALTSPRMHTALPPLRPGSVQMDKSPAPARRHTAGEADEYLHYSPTPMSPAGDWVKVKHRDASPIGMRSLSVSHSERRRSADSRMASASASGKAAEVRVQPPAEDDCGRDYEMVHVPVALRRPATTGAGPCDAPETETEPRPARRKPLLDAINSGFHRLSRNVSGSSRRERSYTDSVIERAWRSYVEHGDEKARESAEKMAADDAASGDVFKPLPEPWMWQQAAIAVRYRRSQSLSANAKQH